MKRGNNRVSSTSSLTISWSLGLTIIIDVLLGSYLVPNNTAFAIETSHYRSVQSGITTDTESQRGPAQIISTIRDLLNQTIDEYRGQNYTGASSLADIAYIDNFEFIEAPLEEKDEQLMEQTETMLREDLSRLIEEKAPLEQVQQLIDQINKQLDRAEQLLLSSNSTT